jgi:hypothetical protein
MAYIAASKEALWVIDRLRMPRKYNEVTKKFERKGHRTSRRIASGLNNQAVVTGWDDKLYGWIEKESVWRQLGPDKVEDVAYGEQGRLYKVDY